MKAYRHLSQIVTLVDARRKDGRKLLPQDLSIIQNGSIVFDDEKILWVGPDSDFPAEYQSISSFDLSGYVLTPGLVDSHTHLVFAGDRSKEYIERLNGIDYQTIAKRGGGILHTVKLTCDQSEDELYSLSYDRIEKIESYGVRVIEIKSGYALTLEGELKMLRVIQRLKAAFKQRLKIIATFMGAHAVPAGYLSSADYMEKSVIPTLKAAHKENLVDCVDIFHESGYFSKEDTQLLFSEAKKLSVPCKIHADEFQDNEGAKIACINNALSADHLLKVSSEGIKYLSTSQTVATILPGTAFFLGKPLPPARELLDSGCKVALASDYNPGSSHVDNLLLVASISAPSLKLNSAELWCAITLNAAHALGLKNQGSLERGQHACFSLFKAQDVSQITYNWGVSLSVSPP